MEETRQRLIHAALELFLSQGLHVTGVAAIAARARVTKMTLYGHFPSKDSLIVACLEERDRIWRARVEQLRDDLPDPLEALLAFFDLYQGYVERDSHRGCLFVNSAAEFSSMSHPVFQAVERHKEGVREQLATLARLAKFNAPRQIADSLFLLLEGSFVSAGRGDSTAVFDTARQMARQWLQSQPHEEQRT